MMPDGHDCVLRERATSVPPTPVFIHRASHKERAMEGPNNIDRLVEISTRDLELSEGTTG